MKQVIGNKLTFGIWSPKDSTEIKIIEAIDNRTGKPYDGKWDYTFGNMEDMKESMCWYFDGDPRKFKVKWDMTTAKGTHGTVYIFD